MLEDESIFESKKYIQFKTKEEYEFFNVMTEGYNLILKEYEYAGQRSQHRIKGRCFN